jgi:hypothetical protein
MEQRRLRLGDTLDDYCPRERRVTNHAIVAMVDEDVKQTRCTTCDSEHAYKGGKAPRRRKKDTTGALYKEVLAGMPESDNTPVLTAPQSSEPADDGVIARQGDESLVQSAPDPGPEGAPEIDPFESESEPAVVREDGPVHRPLIRATLPRIEGQKDARPATEFTIRQSGGRGNGNYRDHRAKPAGGQGQHPGRSQGNQRFAGPRGAGQGRGTAVRGQGPGFRTAGQPPRRGGRKRSR